MRTLISLIILTTACSANAIYLGQNQNGQPLPRTAKIPALVSILDATDTNGKTNSIPYRVFKIGGIESWSFQHDCAGTLITNNTKMDTAYVLTAAHCVTDPATQMIDGPMNKRIIIGNSWCQLQKNNTTQCTTKLAQDDPNVYTVSAIYVDRNWFYSNPASGEFNNNDFAILQIKGTMKIAGKPITPMQIAYQTKDWQNMQNLYVAGWGTTKASEHLNYQKNKTLMSMPHEQPNFAQVTTLPSAQCQSMMNAAKTWIFPHYSHKYTIDEDKQICTGAIAKVKLPFKSSGFCYGDSGGPLFYTSNKHPSTWNTETAFTLAGNVSGSLALCLPALCDATTKQASSTPITTQIKNCYDSAHNAQRISVPNVYGYPGSVLCADDALNQAIWISAGNTFLQTSIKGLASQSLNKITHNGLHIRCA